MIEIFTGVPGSGKSAHAAREIAWYLRHDRPVITNFRLNTDSELWHYLPNEDMSAGRILDLLDAYWDTSGVRFREDWGLIVLDEAQIIFNSRRWSDGKRMAYLEFMTQSRKYGVRIILISQNIMMIDNQFRMIIEQEYNHRRVQSMGPVGLLLSLPVRGRLSLCVRYLVQGRERLGMDLYLWRKSDFQIYDSYARFERQE